MKLMVCGYGRHGKDTFCELSGLKFESSSYFALHAFIWPAWGIMQNYLTPEKCFEDRHNHRAKWHELIKRYNKDDKARLARAIFSENDIYCGIRCREEFNAAKADKLFDYSIWVDASDRHPPEPKDSCTITPDMCDFVLSNNGTEAEFSGRVYQFMRFIK